MSRKTCTAAIMFACVALAFALHAQDQEAAGAIDPEADALLRKMCEWIASPRIANVQAVDTIDIMEGEQKIQYSHVRVGTVHRPNRIKLDTSGDIINRTIWMDGSTVTILDKDQNVYAQVEATGTIDETIDLLLDKFDVTFPLADLFSEDPYQVFTKDARSGKYLGVHLAGMHACHHLAFSQDDLDWQLWIDAGEKPILRKMLLTYTNLPGQPQYTVTMVTYEELSESPDKAFQFTPPEGAEKIEFLPTQR